MNMLKALGPRLALFCLTGLPSLLLALAPALYLSSGSLHRPHTVHNWSLRPAPATWQISLATLAKVCHSLGQVRVEARRLRREEGQQLLLPAAAGHGRV